MPQESPNLVFPLGFIPSGVNFERIKKSQRRRKKSKTNKWLNLSGKRASKKFRRRTTKSKKPRLRLIPIDRNKFEPIQAPLNFSLIENTEEVLGYFRRAAKIISKRTQIEFDLEKIENLTPDAIALLIAKIKDKEFMRGLEIQGNKPAKKELKRLFEESGFFDHVKSAYKTPKNVNHLLIHQVTHKKVHPEIAKQVALLAVKYTFNSDEKFQPIFKIMIECMANTDNHAHLKKEGFHDWWLFRYCNPDNKITSFTFLDLGVGIFNSNPVNTYRQTLLRRIGEAAKIVLTSSANPSLVPDLFSGAVYTSRTKDKTRGQGLPSIKELSAHPQIKNFTIITNNVKIKLPSLDTLLLQNRLNGTLLYWELHPK